jgi:FkbM family methyltransferase
MIKSLILKSLRSTGFTLLANHRYERLRQLEHYKPADTPFADHVRRILEKRQVDCVFDVGANDGAYAIWLRKEAGFKGHIVSFEPIPRHAAALEKLATQDAKWHIMPVALGREAGTSDFHVMASDVFSSFLKPDASQPGQYADSNKVSETIPVTVRTVADVWAELSPKLQASRLYLKMDTQGFDLEVFAGATAAIPSIVALQSEMAFHKIYAGCAGFEEALACFQAAGFRLSMLHPISLDDQLAMIEADGVFVRA